MPSISVFYGITIYMYFYDHGPSHIHAFYGDYRAMICIDDCEIIKGFLPNNAERLVNEWITLHREELIEMWNNQEIHKIAPLDEER